MSKSEDEKKDFGKSLVEQAAPTILRLYEMEKVIVERLTTLYIEKRATYHK